MRYCISTFGCKVNRYESEKIDQSLAKAGHERTLDWKEAEYFILNGCVVTAKSESKNKRLLRKVIKERPDIKVIAAGCLAEKGGLPEGVLKVGAQDKIKNILDLFNVSEITSLESFSGRNRAFIKIQDGCDQFCTYCIIPYLRGRSRNMNRENIVKEAAVLSGKGYGEIVLTGIHVGRNSELTEIIKDLSMLENVKRIRLSSIDITEVDDRLLGLIETDRKVMPHLHISLQSGSDDVLKRMKRPYDSEMFRNAAERIRSRVPRIGLTTDLIVGFPGETEKDFNDSLEMIDHVNFHRVHVFPFSPRPGTKAWEMDGKINAETMRVRVKKAAEKGDVSFDRYVESMKGKETEVLVEELGKGHGTGYGSEYLRTSLDGTFHPGEIIRVIMDGNHKEGLCSCIVKQAALKEER